MDNPVIRWFNRRRVAYKALFDMNNRDAKVVLADLKRFCKYNKSTFHSDSHIAAYQAGRRDVLERITEFVNLSDEQITSIKEE